MTEELIQGSEDWLKIRLGKVTASRVADVIARTKTGFGASRTNYAAQLICERLTGAFQDSFKNAAMQHGIDTEPHARAAYEFRIDVSVIAVGFVQHPRIEMSGASPDGLIGADGLVEIKCPQTATHIETLLGGSVPGKHIAQIQWQLACTDRQWCDYVSFDPRLPPSMQMFVQRVLRNGSMIIELEQQVNDFLDEIDGTIRRLTASYGLNIAA